jgi:O-glycosyl hydrolase
MSDTNERTGYGVLEGPASYTSSPALSTTVVEITLPATASGAAPLARRVVLTNGSASATIGWVDSPTVPAAFTSDYNATTGMCAHIPPLGQQEFTIDGTKRLFVVASAAATSFNCAVYTYI